MKYSLTTVTNAMFSGRKSWGLIPDEDKEHYFFIVNRYLSKIYPEQAQLLNDKLIDKVMGMDTWYAFMLDKPYPSEMWSKPEDVLPQDTPDDEEPSHSDAEKKSKKILFSQKDLLNLQKEMQITSSELEILIKYHEKEVKDELKYLKQQQNE